MKVVILWEPVALTFESLIPDATVQEVHRGSTQITKHPIETGAEITDHSVLLPDTCDLEVVLSNTPIQYLAAFRNPVDRALQAFAKILQLQAEGHKAFIFTGLREYEDMMLSNWEVMRDSLWSDSIRLRMSFEQIVTVESQLTEAPEPTPQRAKAKKPGGKKAKKNASLTTENKASLVVQALRLLF